MTVRAPGKVMIAGEYAVLLGAPSIVMAVDRYAYARAATSGPAGAPSHLPEAAAALARARTEGLIRAVPPIQVDTHELEHESQTKLGLGSSAAACVATLGAAVVAEGGDLRAERARIARIARHGHRQAQGGGSGVDVLACALGGVCLIEFPEGPQAEPQASPLQWPAALRWAVLWTGVPARTSDLIQWVRAYSQRDPEGMTRRMEQIRAATDDLTESLRAGDDEGVIRAVQDHYRAQLALGRAARSPIVTEPMELLAAFAEPLGGALKPSGAGGGDVALAFAPDADSLAAIVAEGANHGFVPLDLTLDQDGVRALGA